LDGFVGGCYHCFLSRHVGRLDVYRGERLFEMFSNGGTEKRTEGNCLVNILKR
jgi:hypothetical protein